MNATATLLLTLTTSFHQATAEPPLADIPAMIRDLGGAYRERTAATRKLYAMGEDARPHLQRAAGDADLEVARRAEMLLAWLNSERRKRAMAAIDAAFASPLPWIDLAYIAPHDPEACRALSGYLDRAYEAVEAREDCPPAWGKYRGACRILLHDMAEAGVPIPVIRLVVAELAQREAAWYAQWKSR